MLFRLEANCEFEAENIDDAFKVMSKHFAALEDEGVEAEDFIITGKIRISKSE